MTALADRLAAVAAIDPTAPAIEFEGAWSTWGDLDRTAAEVARVLADAGLGPGAPVGMLLRNRPAALGAFLGLLRAEACVVTLSPLLGAERVGHDVVALALPLVIGERADLDMLPSESSGSVALAALGALGDPIDLAPPRATPVWECSPGVALRMLTSGTTGPPKRIDLRSRVLEQVMAGAKHYETGTGSDVRLRDGVVVVNAPLVHVSGVFRVVQAVLDGRRIALLERFTVDGWSDAVRRHRPKTVSLVPTALSMVLDADVDVDVFASVRSVVSGTAPLDPALADAFTARYGVPVLTSYGATEFGGGVAGWNLTDHTRYGAEKRGSVGRAHAGCALRVIDPQTGAVADDDDVGVLEVRAAQLDTADWVRTTDLARIDDDGFLWIVGRADQTIVRGGFKVQPEMVRAALERDPGVSEATVIGLPDRRLGAVPVAMVERRVGHDVDVAALLARAAEQLAPYELPVSITVTAALPRVESGKVDLAAVRALLEPRDSSASE